MRYRLTISPRAPRRHARYLVGLLLTVLSVSVVMLSGMAASFVTHAAASALVAL
jgi:hypothetical protein